MNLENMKRKYAYTLARIGLNVQKGQVVLVEAIIEGYEFANMFAEECYKLGASKVIISYLDLNKMKIDSKYQSYEEIIKLEEYEIMSAKPYLDNGACYIRLEGVDTKLMEDVSENSANAIFKHIDAMRNIMRKASRDYNCQWCIGMIPTKKWALEILDGVNEAEAEDKLWQLLFKLCYINEDNDVVKTWEELNLKRQKLGNKLDALNIKELHYKSSNGNDLKIGLTPNSKFGSINKEEPHIIFNPNIPTEEIFTSPDKYMTNGIVYASKPLVLGGKRLDNFGFRFKNGKVVEIIANEGKEMLEELINTDENAGYLGEVALVEYHSPISMSGIIYNTTLIDENASCHLALGRAVSANIENNSHFNESSIHIDFMIGTKDLEIKAITYDNKEVIIFKDGDFALE